MLSEHEKTAISESIGRCSLPLKERWTIAEQKSFPTDAWHSFDRTPWKHPWLRADNIRHFAAYSRRLLAQLEIQLAKEAAGRKPGRFAFVGNMANVNYIRALPLRRRGVDVDLVLHPHDEFIFAQPAWEEFDGEITVLGEDPGARLFQAELPNWVHRSQTESNWAHIPFELDKMVVTPDQILLWPECMPYLPTLSTLSRYDSLLVSQFPYLGFLSGRPYLFGQIGGEIWFEASRNDALGVLTRRAIAKSYAVLVSNPITLAHARRYGLNNLLYVPWPLDEEVYSPGDATDIRAEWQASLGGEFFVLTSMRIDRHWKGAHLVLEGFAQLASHSPQARLVVLGWGEDLDFAKKQVAKAGLADKVLFLPTVGKRKLVRCLRAADVALEQFVLGYYGASGLEAMACGKPVIMRIEKEQYDALIEVGAPPVLNAETGADVARHLRRLYDDKDFCRALGKQTREWFLKAQSSQKWSETYRVLLEAMAGRIPLTFGDSPLSERLSDEESDYHSAQLAQAPPFPHYVDP